MFRLAERTCSVAAPYPYALTPKKIPVLFDLIRKRGAPPENAPIDTWLKQVGFTTENDRRFKSVLRYIGFTDEKDAPTARWRAYRGSNGATILAEGIREGYKDLFGSFPDAQSASEDDLLTFVKGHTSYSDNTANYAVATFKGLVGLADFGDASAEVPAASQSGSNGSDAPTIPADIARPRPEVAVRQVQGPGVTINVNIQLSLPESNDPAVYDALFAALAKHVLSNDA
jgi:hypothetical protein